MGVIVIIRKKNVCLLCLRVSLCLIIIEWSLDCAHGFIIMDYATDELNCRIWKELWDNTIVHCNQCNTHRCVYTRVCPFFRVCVYTCAPVCTMYVCTYTCVFVNPIEQSHAWLYFIDLVTYQEVFFFLLSCFEVADRNLFPFSCCIERVADLL